MEQSTAQVAVDDVPGTQSPNSTLGSAELADHTLLESSTSAGAGAACCELYIHTGLPVYLTSMSGAQYLVRAVCLERELTADSVNSPICTSHLL
jgi:hypothetical protein